MAVCVQCGVSIPDKQSICSMCFGDADYGRDGYYRGFLMEQERLHAEREAEWYYYQQEREQEEEYRR